MYAVRIMERERRARGWSQSELARRAHMNGGTVNQIESGYIGQPYASQLHKLAAALGWTENPADLLRESGAE